jgi:uncharacterized protein (DUF2141 family)
MRKVGSAAVAAVFMFGSASAGPGSLPNSHVSCTGAPNEIRVIIPNVKKSVGLVTVELYRNEPGHFLTHEGREVKLRFAAIAPRTEVCIHAQQAGDYAVGIYHDENANMKIDKGAFGIPTEPYGLSNNPKFRLAPPKIEDALFHVEKTGAKLEIRLKN